MINCKWGCPDLNRGHQLPKLEGYQATPQPLQWVTLSYIRIFINQAFLLQFLRNQTRLRINSTKPSLAILVGFLIELPKVDVIMVNGNHNLMLQRFEP
jgi:hypothetical protein